MTDVDVQYNAAERTNSGFLGNVAPLPPIDSFFRAFQSSVPECTEELLTIKIMTPEGALFGFDDINGEVTWTRHLKSPIAGAWKYHCRSLVKLDLSDPSLVPDLNPNTKSEDPESFKKRPSMYLGSFNNMWYVQVFHSPIDIPTTHTPNLSFNHNMLYAQSKHSWVPYIATSPSRTPYLNQENSVLLLDQSSVEEFSTALMPINHEISYPYDAGFSIHQQKQLEDYESSVGFYFVLDRPSYFDYKTRQEITNDHGDRLVNFYEDSYLPNTETILAFVPVSLSYYWKQIAAITVTLAILFNIIIRIYDHLRGQKCPLEGAKNDSNQSVERLNSTESNGNVSKLASGFNEYFTFTEKLGKGGFGQVYVAKHKLDLQRYAIKRIELPRNIESADKMRREVRALSRLNHTHIVRYYNSWEETQTRDSDDILACLNSDSVTESTSFPYVVNSYDPFSISNLLMQNGTESNHKQLRSITSVGSRGDEDDETSNTNQNYMISYIETSDDDLIKFEASNPLEKQLKQRKLQEMNGESVNLEEVSKQSESKMSENVDSETTKNLRKDSLRSFLYIQMELCRPNTLKDWLMDEMERDRNISLHIFHQIVQAVNYVHTAGQFHRDLKPSNIFFSEKEALVKVGDFGLVTGCLEWSDNDNNSSQDFLQLRNSSSYDLSTIQKSNSSSGTSLKHTSKVGTKIYMSPEQRKGRSYDNKVDIYALGLILFELLQPFATESERIVKLKDARSLKFPSYELKDVAAIYTEDDIELMKRMLSVDPANRPSAEELAQDRILSSYKEPTPAARLEKLSRSKSRSSSNMETNSSSANL